MIEEISIDEMIYDYQTAKRDYARDVEVFQIQLYNYLETPVLIKGNTLQIQIGYIETLQFIIYEDVLRKLRTIEEYLNTNKINTKIRDNHFIILTIPLKTEDFFKQNKYTRTIKQCITPTN